MTSETSTQTDTTATDTTETETTDTETGDTATTETETETTETETTGTETTETETNGKPSTTNEVVLGAAFSGVVDFGSAHVGDTVSKPIGIRNATDAARRIVALALTGSSASDFKIVQDDCVGAELAPQETCDFNIDFTPSDRGVRRASLVVSVDPQPNNGASLRGTGGLVIGPTPPTVTDPGVVKG